MVNVADPREGVSTVALREIKFLKEIHSPHVVELLDVFEHKSQLALVGALARLLLAAMGCCLRCAQLQQRPLRRCSWSDCAGVMYSCKATRLRPCCV